MTRPFFRSRAQRVAALLTWVLLAVLVFGCGGGGSGTTGSTNGGTNGGGNVIGDFNTDMVISTNLVVPTELRAKNLIINPGVKVISQGDLVINAAGLTTLNGQIEAGGKLELVIGGGMEVGDQGSIVANDDVFILSQHADYPTQAEMDAFFAQNYGIGAPRSRQAANSGRDLHGNHEKLPPIIWQPGARQKNLWVFVLGTLDVGGNPGGGGAPITYDLPDGAAGANVNADNAKGGNGKDGGSVAIQADKINVTGNVTFNLGSGGDGGSAVAGPTTTPKANATGGKGGGSGKFVMASAFLGILHGIDIQATMSINFGQGGRGGDATASGSAGAAGSPGKDGESATATGGDGGKGAYPGSAGGDVSGLANLVVTANNGGRGGDSFSTGGRGGDDNACPGTHGGKGGSATSKGGAGGSANTSLSGGVAGSITPGPGGDGGDATATGGDGGTGMSCCNPVDKGGDGGAGGNASATVGQPGDGTPVGTAGNPHGQAGDGGNGGDGLPVGAAGLHGTGTNVPDGADGSPGNPCDNQQVGNCQEAEPNDSLATATDCTAPANPNDITNCLGSLSDMADLDHFRFVMPAGTYTVKMITAPAGATNYYLNVGGTVSSPSLGTTSTVIVEVPGTPVYIGLFGGTGAYKVEVKRTE